MMRFLALVFALSACASNPPPSTTPADQVFGNEVAPIRGDCPPEHYWALGLDGREFCEKIVRGPDGCPFGIMRTDSRGRAACLHDAYKDLSVDSGMIDPCDVDPHYQCWWFVEEATASEVSNPEVQDRLAAAEIATRQQCLLRLIRMETKLGRKVAFTAPPGKFRSHFGMPTRDVDGRLVFKDGGHLFDGVADQQGRLFFCPFRTDCDVSVGPNHDEDCLDFANCQETCLDQEGNPIR